MKKLRSRLASLAFVALMLSPAVGPASAEEWGGIEPGVTTIEQVRAKFGAPSKESRQKIEGYDTIEWVYEDTRAPEGIRRMTVGYGLLTPQGYKQTVVRVLQLEPKPHIFGPNTVREAWGVPDAVSSQNDQETYYYKSGLIVTMDKEGNEAVLMSFTLPQPDKPPASPAPAAPKR
jgi:hypothetical protein